MTRETDLAKIMDMMDVSFSKEYIIFEGMKNWIEDFCKFDEIKWED